MAEAQEQRYVCKICSKSCVSGKSLGGHMRVHLASTRKSAAEIKTDYEESSKDDEDDDQLKESSKDQSNSSEEEEEIKNCEESSPDSLGNYGLRENPKKSWRISISDHPKHGLIKNGAASCKQCAKIFPSLRALSGHMRCHSIKNNSEVHRCKECGKEFGSIRAMFGHMKTHSKKSRARDESAADHESLSDFDNLCPVRRKRSRIHYNNIAPIESTSAAAELEEAKEAAACLMMLSRGVGNWSNVDSVTDCSDDCSAYFGGGSLSKSKTDCCISGYASVFSEEILPEFDDHDSKFVAQDEMKVGSGLDVDKLLVVENEMKADQLCRFDDSMSYNPMESTELDKEYFFVGEVSLTKKASVSVNEPDSENKFVIEVLKDSEMAKPDYKCRVRDNKAIARHKLQGSSLVTEADSELDQVKCSKVQLKKESCDVGSVSLKTNKTKEHECPTCFKVFPSGQALGGHKRAHYTVNQEAVAAAQVHNSFDLNFPGARAEVGPNLWWADRRSHEREALVLTN